MAGGGGGGCPVASGTGRAFRCSPIEGETAEGAREGPLWRGTRAQSAVFLADEEYLFRNSTTARA